jgi:alpha-amylase/alpha-mannosidase (GH57 family)
MSDRYLCIHAHFYQPPRENPWLEAIEVQDSAYPYHDWNERITAECYAPNSASRILDPTGRIDKIVSTYAKISFNFGPTLLSWMEHASRDVYDAVLEADRASMERYSGHGSAIAQVYNHMIMPLASRADKYTQVVWGIRDFERRFGRYPEGMWLAETAVDLDTLDVLAELGIKFTILAPHQARRVRRIGDGNWKNVGNAQIDPTTAYVQHLPSGRRINLFFYDGPVSRAVAFEGLLNNGENFARRLMSGFSDDRGRAQLMHIATDGETYGHHHRHGDMALAYALHHIETNNLARLTNYGEFLEQHPPAHEVEIQENTSWSCGHGVERWRGDCGCNTGGHRDWNQQWRGPMREALDLLRDTICPKFTDVASELLKDPWAARNDYISLVLDRSPENITAFCQRNATRPYSTEDRIRVLKLLEMQRHAMLMYTSCGWFFDDLSGIETVQVLQYAGRAIQLAREVFNESNLEQAFLQRVEPARSNLAEYGSGRDIYEKFVRPAAVDLVNVGAHYAISSLFQRRGGIAPTYCYSVARLDHHSFESGRARLAVGEALISSRITEESTCVTFGVLHFGDINLTAGVIPRCARERYVSLIDQSSGSFVKFDLPRTVRLLDRYFGEMTYSLKSLFRDEQRRIVNTITNSILRDAEGAYRQIYDQHAPLIRFLFDLNLPLPRVLQLSAEFVVNGNLRREFDGEDWDVDRIRTLLGTARGENVQLDGAGLGYVIRKNLDREFARLLQAPSDLGLLQKLENAMALVRSLPFEVNLWKAQNTYYALLQTFYPHVRAVQDEESRVWAEHFEALGVQLGFHVQAATEAEASFVVA